MKLITTSAFALMATASIALAGGHCAAGKTLKDGVLTIATGNPAYYPWVMDDAPESKAGFEAAVAYAVANRMGFEDGQVEWVRSSKGMTGHSIDMLQSKFFCRISLLRGLLGSGLHGSGRTVE